MPVRADEAKKADAAPWNADYDKIPAGIRQYDNAVFTNPALLAAWPTATSSKLSEPAIAPRTASNAPPLPLASSNGCANVLPAPPPPLGPGLPPTAANAYRGIQLHCLAENLPDVSRSLPDRGVKSGHYKLHPMLARQTDGSEAVVYWTGYNTDTKRTEFVVGPRDLATFMSAPDRFETAAANAYMHGEPNKWTLESMKAVDSAMRSGWGAGFTHLGRAWVEAVKDPEWWMHNAAAAGALAEGPGLPRATSGSRGLSASGVSELPTPRGLALSESPAPRGVLAAESNGASADLAPAATTTPRGVATAPAAPTTDPPHAEPPASQMGKSSAIVPGGGLAAHEGGPVDAHLIRKHLNKTEADLIARTTKVPGAPRGQGAPKTVSAFYDRTTAELAASRTLAGREADVKEWLAKGAPGKLELTDPTPPSTPVGLSFTRGEAAAVPVSGTKIVLIGDPSMSCGFRILTGYPSP